MFLMNLIRKYNSWVFSLSKVKYIILLLITCILETLALSVLPSIIDNNYSNMSIKFIVIFIVILIINFPTYLYAYKKYNKNNLKEKQ